MKYSRSFTLLLLLLLVLSSSSTSSSLHQFLSFTRNPSRGVSAQIAVDPITVTVQPSACEATSHYTLDLSTSDVSNSLVIFQITDSCHITVKNGPVRQILFQPTSGVLKNSSITIDNISCTVIGGNLPLSTSQYTTCINFDTELTDMYFVKITNVKKIVDGSSVLLASDPTKYVLLLDHDWILIYFQQKISNFKRKTKVNSESSSIPEVGFEISNVDFVVENLQTSSLQIDGSSTPDSTELRLNVVAFQNNVTNFGTTMLFSHISANYSYRGSLLRSFVFGVVDFMSAVEGIDPRDMPLNPHIFDKITVDNAGAPSTSSFFSTSTTSVPKSRVEAMNSLILSNIIFRGNKMKISPPVVANIVVPRMIGFGTVSTNVAAWYLRSILIYDNELSIYSSSSSSSSTSSSPNDNNKNDNMTIIGGFSFARICTFANPVMFIGENISLDSNKMSILYSESKRKELEPQFLVENNNNNINIQNENLLLRRKQFYSVSSKDNANENDHDAYFVFSNPAATMSPDDSRNNTKIVKQLPQLFSRISIVTFDAGCFFFLELNFSDHYHQHDQNSSGGIFVNRSKFLILVKSGFQDGSGIVFELLQFSYVVDLWILQAFGFLPRKLYWVTVGAESINQIVVRGTSGIFGIHVNTSSSPFSPTTTTTTTTTTTISPSPTTTTQFVLPTSVPLQFSLKDNINFAHIAFLGAVRNIGTVLVQEGTIFVDRVETRRHFAVVNLVFGVFVQSTGTRPLIEAVDGIVADDVVVVHSYDRGVKSVAAAVVMSTFIEFYLDIQSIGLIEMRNCKMMAAIITSALIPEDVITYSPFANLDNNNNNNDNNNKLQDQINSLQAATKPSFSNEVMTHCSEMALIYVTGIVITGSLHSVSRGIFLSNNEFHFENRKLTASKDASVAMLRFSAPNVANVSAMDLKNNVIIVGHLVSLGTNAEIFIVKIETPTNNTGYVHVENNHVEAATLAVVEGKKWGTSCRDAGGFNLPKTRLAIFEVSESSDRFVGFYVGNNTIILSNWADSSEYSYISVFNVGCLIDRIGPLENSSSSVFKPVPTNTNPSSSPLSYENSDSENTRIITEYEDYLFQDKIKGGLLIENCHIFVNNSFTRFAETSITIASLQKYIKTIALGIFCRNSSITTTGLLVLFGMPVLTIHIAALFGISSTPVIKISNCVVNLLGTAAAEVASQQQQSGIVQSVLRSDSIIENVYFGIIVEHSHIRIRRSYATQYWKAVVVDLCLHYRQPYTNKKFAIQNVRTVRVSNCSVELGLYDAAGSPVTAILMFAYGKKADLSIFGYAGIQTVPESGRIVGMDESLFPVAAATTISVTDSNITLLASIPKLPIDDQFHVSTPSGLLNYSAFSSSSTLPGGIYSNMNARYSPIPALTMLAIAQSVLITIAAFGDDIVKHSPSSRYSVKSIHIENCHVVSPKVRVTEQRIVIEVLRFISLPGEGVRVDGIGNISVWNSSVTNVSAMAENGFFDVSTQSLSMDLVPMSPNTLILLPLAEYGPQRPVLDSISVLSSRVNVKELWISQKEPTTAGRTVSAGVSVISDLVIASGLQHFETGDCALELNFDNNANNNNNQRRRHLKVSIIFADIFFPFPTSFFRNVIKIFPALTKSSSTSTIPTISSSIYEGLTIISIISFNSSKTSLSTSSFPVPVPNNVLIQENQIFDHNGVCTSSQQQQQQQQPLVNSGVLCCLLLLGNTQIQKNLLSSSTSTFQFEKNSFPASSALQKMRSRPNLITTYSASEISFKKNDGPKFLINQQGPMYLGSIYRDLKTEEAMLQKSSSYNLQQSQWRITCSNYWRTSVLKDFLTIASPTINSQNSKIDLLVCDDNEKKEMLKYRKQNNHLFISLSESLSITETKNPTRTQSPTKTKNYFVPVVSALVTAASTYTTIQSFTAALTSTSMATYGARSRLVMSKAMDIAQGSCASAFDAETVYGEDATPTPDQSPLQLFFGKKKYSQDRDGDNDLFLEKYGGSPGWMGGVLIGNVVFVFGCFALFILGYLIFRNCCGCGKKNENSSKKKKMQNRRNNNKNNNNSDDSNDEEDDDDDDDEKEAENGGSISYVKISKLLSSSHAITAFVVVSEMLVGKTLESALTIFFIPNTNLYWQILSLAILVIFVLILFLFMTTYKLFYKRNRIEIFELSKSEKRILAEAEIAKRKKKYSGAIGIDEEERELDNLKKGQQSKNNKVEIRQQNEDDADALQLLSSREDIPVTCTEHLAKYYAYLLHPQGEWIIPKKKTISRKDNTNNNNSSKNGNFSFTTTREVPNIVHSIDRANFRIALPMIEGYRETAPRFFIFDILSVMLMSASTSIIANAVYKSTWDAARSGAASSEAFLELKAKSNNKACTATAALIITILSIYFIATFYLKPFTERLNRVCIPIATLLQIICVVCALAGLTPDQLGELLFALSLLTMPFSFLALLGFLIPMGKLGLKRLSRKFYFIRRWIRDQDEDAMRRQNAKLSKTMKNVVEKKKKEYFLREKDAGDDKNRKDRNEKQGELLSTFLNHYDDDDRRNSKDKYGRSRRNARQDDRRSRSRESDVGNPRSHSSASRYRDEDDLNRNDSRSPSRDRTRKNEDDDQRRNYKSHQRLIQQSHQPQNMSPTTSKRNLDAFVVEMKSSPRFVTRNNKNVSDNKHDDDEDQNLLMISRNNKKTSGRKNEQNEGSPRNSKPKMAKIPLQRDLRHSVI